MRKSRLSHVEHLIVTVSLSTCPVNDCPDSSTAVERGPTSDLTKAVGPEDATRQEAPGQSQKT